MKIIFEQKFHFSIIFLLVKKIICNNNKCSNKVVSQQFWKDPCIVRRIASFAIAFKNESGQDLFSG